MSGEERFEAIKAERGIQPLLVILCGASWSGKTLSAISLATGMKLVTKQDIVLVDTEAPRGSMYADQHEYAVVRLDPPYPPERFIAVLAQYEDSILIIDSWSEEHEGEGGMLEIQDATVRADTRNIKEGKKSQAAWITTKGRRNKLKRVLSRHPGIVILCVRAKRPSEAGKDYWTAITGDCFMYPAAACIFLDGDGVPAIPKGAIDDNATRVINSLRRCLDGQLDAHIGRNMALWAYGRKMMPRLDHPLLVELANVTTLDDLKSVDGRIKKGWPDYDRRTRMNLEWAGTNADARLSEES